jgi:glycosyltransferase involved in cell wall biosynthesis
MKRKLLFVTTKLGGGGAERHLVRIANALTATCEVHVAVARNGGGYEDLLSKNIVLHRLSRVAYDCSTLLACIKAIRPLRRLLVRGHFNAVMSLLEPATFLVHQASTGVTPKPLVLASVQNNYSASSRQGRLSFLTRPLFRNSLTFADRVVTISEGVRSDLLNCVPKLACKTEVIYNAAIDDYTKESLRDPYDPTPIGSTKQNTPVIIACGRLVPQKDFGTLLTAFSQIVKTRPCALKILGDGPLKKKLMRHCTELGISEHVEFLGFRKNPMPYFAEADVFVLSSLWEGFGNVIVEAMSVGTPVVSTDCPFGPSEIITHEQSGLLVPVKCPTSLAQSVLNLLDDSALYSKIRATALSRAQDFSATKIALKYAEAMNALPHGDA